MIVPDNIDKQSIYTEKVILGLIGRSGCENSQQKGDVLCYGLHTDKETRSL